MRRWNLRKYGYILVWLALAGAVGLAWLLGRDSPPTAGAGEASSSAAATPAPSEVEPSSDQEKLVGLWVPYFSLSTAENTQAAFQENYKAIVQQAKEVGVNAMFVHVRPFCDSLYPSGQFPWSHVLTGEQGKDPGWDPLAFLVEYTHSQGMEFHAWVNPLRVKTAQTPASLASDNPYETWKAEHPYYFMEWEGGLYLDPAYPEIRSLIAQGVGEIVENYPVDGVHFDDYFYPSQSGELDEEAYTLYTGNTADPLPLLEWRQANINTLVAECYQAVKQADAEAVFGISPQGNIANDLAMGADVTEWAAVPGYVDYLCPQLYYSFENEALGYREALSQWESLPRHQGLSLYAGLALYKAGTDADGGTWLSQDNIIALQAQAAFAAGWQGVVLYSSDSLTAPAAQAEVANAAALLGK